MDPLSDRTRKRNAALIKTYGSLENYRKEARKWGATGGKKSKPNLTFEQYSKAGKLGHAAMIKKLTEGNHENTM